MIERFDPQELERMIDEGIDKIAENIKVDAINKEEQISLQTMRAEASDTCTTYLYGGMRNFVGLCSIGSNYSLLPSTRSFYRDSSFELTMAFAAMKQR